MVLVGNYKLEERIGDPGTQGQVYKARHISSQEPAAVKILRDPTPERITRLEEEAGLLGSLDHPNIVHIQNFGHDPAYPVYYLATDLVNGVSLAKVLEARNGDIPGQLTPQETLEIAEQLIWALAAAHARGIYHLDLKPHTHLRIT